MRIPFTQDVISKKGAVIGTGIVASATLATEHLVIPQGAKLIGWGMYKLFGGKATEQVRHEEPADIAASRSTTSRKRAEG